MERVIQNQKDSSIVKCSACMGNLKVLELTASAGAGEIRQAYMQLVKVWHPDRFPEDEGLREQSEERFKQVQVAYRELQEHAGRHVVAVQSESEKAEEAAAEVFAVALKRLLVRYADRHQAVFEDRKRIFVSPNIPPEAWKKVAAQDEFAKEEMVGAIRAGRSVVDWNSFVLLAKRQVLLGGVSGFERDAMSYHRFSQAEVWFRRKGQAVNILERWTRRPGPGSDLGGSLYLKDAKTGKQAVLFANMHGDRRITQSLCELLNEVQRLAARD